MPPPGAVSLLAGCHAPLPPSPPGRGCRAGGAWGRPPRICRRSPTRQGSSERPPTRRLRGLPTPPPPPLRIVIPEDGAGPSERTLATVDARADGRRSRAVHLEAGRPIIVAGEGVSESIFLETKNFILCEEFGAKILYFTLLYFRGKLVQRAPPPAGPTCQPHRPRS